MKHNWILLIVATLLINSCKESNSAAVVSPVDSLRTVVMDLHNVEMEKMGQMKMLERELDEMIEASDSTEDPETYGQLRSAMMQLDSGTFAMKSWMRNWSEPDSLATVADQIEGLNQQHESMKRTRDLMNKGIEAAQQALNKDE